MEQSPETVHLLQVSGVSPCGVEMKPGEPAFFGELASTTCPRCLALTGGDTIGGLALQLAARHGHGVYDVVQRLIALAHGIPWPADDAGWRVNVPISVHLTEVEVERLRTLYRQAGGVTGEGT